MAEGGSSQFISILSQQILSPLDFFVILNALGLEPVHDAQEIAGFKSYSSSESV
jgi:hypothetical protein